MVTLRHGYCDKVTRLDMGLLDSLIREVNIGYTITRHILTSPGVTYRPLPYKNIITQILRHFYVTLTELVHIEIKKLRLELISAISF